MSGNAASPVIYDSVYRQRLDEKRRVPVPHRWRSAKGEQLHLVIWPKHHAGTCLRVLTPDLMAKTLAKIDAMPDNDHRKSVLKRSIGSASTTVTVDTAGRIAIPEEMAQAADLAHDAVFVGMLDRFEIWSPKRHTEVGKLDAAALIDALQLLE